MERLTERDIHGNAICKKEISIDCNANCKDCDYIYECFKKLADYEDAEEQGLLLKLPCKVGTPIWWISHRNFIFDGIVEGYRLLNNGIVLLDAFGWGYGEFGENVFLTKEEAEQKLASMQKGE